MNITSRLEGTVHITGDVVGPRAVIFGGIHGDEVSGLHAIEKVLFDFLAGERVLVRGSLTLARGNALAIAKQCRYVGLNLNRLFKESYGSEVETKAYEFRRAQELKSILRDCDYFFDFHSAPIASEPFLIAEGKSVSFFAKLGLPRIISGWSKFSDGPIGGDAETYASGQGAVAATLESGSHFDKRSNDIAYEAAISFLTALNMLEKGTVKAPGRAEIFEIYRVVTKEANDFRYTPQVKNFQFFREGEPFAYENGAPLTVAEDTYLLIPMTAEQTKIHEEVGYLGRKVA